MLSLAGQTAGPIGLKFFVDTYGLKNKKFSFKLKRNLIFSNFFPRATPGPSTSNK